MPRYRTIGVEEVLNETGMAYLFVIDGEEVWIPKSQMEDSDAVCVGDTEVEVEISQWLCEEKWI